ncbi:TM2 domain-containing protein [Flavobacterium sp. RSSA_27]|uniref:TM2 domain-containing protein n=1 Tax=Flavobacterium sp. RSSA_27 TaxID=3447667 RepID=UPI003F2D95E4
MKKHFLLSLIALFFISSFSSYASFPVENRATTNGTTQTTITNSNEKEELTSPAIVGSGKSQVVALLLCIFVGVIGIHRFYLGYTWQGIVQLLTLGLFGIWTLIDLIRIITGDLQPKGGSYSKTF